MQATFSLNFRVVILAAVLLPILLWLGNWQLRREAEKKTIQSTFTARQQQTPVYFQDLEPGSDLAFMPLSLRGRFDRQHTFLLDNRVYQGQVGYEVMVPLQLEIDSQRAQPTWLLINRGWIKAPARRTELPKIPALPDDGVELFGDIYVPPGKGYQLSVPEQDSSWPTVINVVDPVFMGEQLGYPVFGYQVRLKAGQPGALIVDWPRINVSPEKHRAYAVQWFAMAAALVVWLVVASLSFGKVGTRETN